VAQLPKPLQVSAFGNKDWNLTPTGKRWTFVAGEPAKPNETDRPRRRCGHRGILLFLLTASANTPLFARNYTPAAGLNGAVAATWPAWCSCSCAALAEHRARSLRLPPQAAPDGHVCR
jgi:hypothetical protein